VRFLSSHGDPITGEGLHEEKSHVSFKQLEFFPWNSRSQCHWRQIIFAQSVQAFGVGAWRWVDTSKYPKVCMWRDTIATDKFWLPKNWLSSR
jgi:hypothetical protein